MALATRLARENTQAVIKYWYPAYGHPDGPSDIAWFRVVDGWGYRTKHSPAGPSESPSFRMVADLAYPVLAMPGSPPTFQVIGSFAYTDRGAPWFRIEVRPG